MCGINGLFVHGQTKSLDPLVLRRTRDAMAQRGPDGFGEWIAADGRVGFGHRRLSIIDLTETGAQPMHSADGTISVTFNGEIYNYRALRQELEAAGCLFHSQSDTEVLIHLYRRHGTEMLKRLRGMFAFGLFDAGQRRLLLARDPYGIKPLYYSDEGGTLQFASSVKALVAGGAVSCAPDPAGIVGFQIFGSVPEPWTTYKAIKAIPAGSFAIVDAEGMRAPAPFFSLAATYLAAQAQQADLGDAAEFVRCSLLDSVRHHLVADVPVGAFLSAGIDSGALVGLMRDAGQAEIRTVTLAFEAFRGTEADESVLAQKVARKYGTQHTTRWVGAKEFHDDLPKILAAMDQPSIDGINTWFVSKATRELGLKVALSGVGGDELLGGYNTFARLPMLVRSMRYVPKLPGAPMLAQRAADLARLVGIHLHPKYAGLLAYGRSFAGAYLLQRSVHLPAEVGALLGDPVAVAAGLAELAPLALLSSALPTEVRSDFSKVAILESCFYLRNQLLRDTDWAGMANSVEIRTPLVDHVLLERLAPLLAGHPELNGKAMLAGAPSVALPDEVVHRRKTGFGIPLKSWFLELPGWSEHARTERDSDRLWSRTWMKQISRISGQGTMTHAAEPRRASPGQKRFDGIGDPVRRPSVP